MCTHNAGRSQMAAALLNREAADRIRVTSAGSEPATAVNPAVVAAMAEGRDRPVGGSPQAPRAGPGPGSRRGRHDGLRRRLPVFPGKRYLDWQLPDPAGLTVEQVRPIRDEITRRVRALAAELTAASEG